MSRKYTRWTKELLEPVCKTSFSYREVLQKLNLVCAGGNYKNLQKNISKFDIDISHMVHQAHNQGKEFIKFNDLSKVSSIKRRFAKEVGYFCSNCGIHTWNDRPLTLELDHIDGDNRNNAKDNLRLLCPNCHSQTNTFRNRKR